MQPKTTSMKTTYFVVGQFLLLFHGQLFVEITDESLISHSEGTVSLSAPNGFHT